MTRVSENSSSASLNFAINKVKEKLENLQLKGSTLKNMTRPSDDPIGSVEVLALETTKADNLQFNRTSDYSQLQLNATEKSLEQLTNIMLKAKEIALTQSSDFYDADIRKNVANEIIQLKNQALAISNKRIGSRYIFGGYSSLSRPFSDTGEYLGDRGKIRVEISKDFFVPINLTGEEIFYATEDMPQKGAEGIQKIEESPNNTQEILSQERNLASIDRSVQKDGSQFKTRDNIFAQLTTLINGLENNDPSLIQGLLPKIDNTMSRLITLRTRIGSITNSIGTAQQSTETENLGIEARKSKIKDADIAELFSEIQKQQNILTTSYQASKGMMNKKLLDFLR